MSESLDGSSIAGALQSQGGMRQWMRAVNRNLLLHRNMIGAFPLSGIGGDATLTVKKPPPPVEFNVIGTDGQFQITITLPQDVQPPSVTLFQQSFLENNNQLGTLMVHQLQSATTVLFDEAGGVVTYGPFSELTQTFQLPNQTLFWRIRSSFDGNDWNEWQIYSSPAFCGPIGVYSGVLRNSANSINQAATTASGNNPLTQSGTTTVINVAASVWKCGDQTITYNGGSVNPGSYGTWLVYANDSQRLGGTVTFIAVNTLNQAIITADNGNVYFGQITTSSGGGGTGLGGGGGTCCRAGVPYRMLDGNDRDCSLLRVGNVLLGADGGAEVIQSIELHPARPCFRLEFDPSGKLTTKKYIGDFTVYAIQLDRSHTFLAGHGGVIDGACSTHTVQYAGGGFVSVFEMVPGEVFALFGGAVGSHNYRKLQ
ncbi:MAG TPA: hypothetical protein VI685_24970 [Candidatus Angelobacter sp.]